MDPMAEQVLTTINIKSFPNPNVITQNFSQGILIVEGSYAKVISNKIDNNIKANIAVGGVNSGNTRIKYNYIEESNSEQQSQQPIPIIFDSLISSKKFQTF